MVKKIVTLTTVLTYICTSTAFAAGNEFGLTEKQMDDIVATAIVEKHPKDSDRLAAIGMATHFTQSRILGIRDTRELSDVPGFSLNPLAPETYTFMFKSKIPAPVDKQEYLNKTVKDMIDNTAPLNLRNSTRVRLGTAAVDLGVIGGSVAYPPAAPLLAAGKVGFEVLKESAIQEAESRPRFFPKDRAVKIETISRMQKEIRDNTPAGQAYAKIFKELSEDDPKVPNEQKTAVQDGAVRKAVLSKNKTKEQNLLNNGEYQKALEKVNKGITTLRQQFENYRTDADDRALLDSELANQAEAERRRKLQKELREKQVQESVRDLQNARGTLMIASYILGASGDKEGARIAMGTAEIADKVSTILASAATAAPMMLVAGWIGVAIMVVVLIQKSNEPESPYPAIFKMLEQNAKQISELREDMLNSIGRMDNRLGNMLATNIELTEAIKQNTEVMRDQLNKLQDQLQETRDAMTAQNSALADLFLTQEDKGCLRVRNGKLLEPRPDFMFCQSTYLYRATEFARGAIANAQVSDKIDSPLRDAQGPFPFAGKYQTLQQDLGLPGLPLANPNVWFGSVTRYLALLEAFPKNLDDIDLSVDGASIRSATLDPLIQTGEAIRNFIYGLAFEMTQFRNEEPILLKLKTDNFEALLTEMKIKYQTVLAALAKQLGATGVHADITKDSSKQVADVGFHHAFLAGASVPFCKYKGAGITVKSVKGWVHTRQGGGNGIREYWKETELGALRLKVWEVMMNHKASEFQPDVSIVPVIDNAVRLSEMIHQTPIQVCLQDLEISNFDVTFQNGTQLDVRMKFYVSAVVNGKLEPVQSIEGTHHISSDFFFFVSCPNDCQTRHVELAQKITTGMRGQFGKFKATPVNGDKLSVLRDQVDNTLRRKRSELRQNIAFKTESDRIERIRTDLTMIVGIGMDLQHKKVDEVFRELNDQSKFPTIATLVDDAITNGKPLTELNKSITTKIEGLAQKFKELEPLKDQIAPSTYLLDVRLNQLRLLKDIRARQKAM